MNWPSGVCALAWLSFLSVFASESVGLEHSKTKGPGLELASQWTKEQSIKPTQTTREPGTLFSLDLDDICPSDDDSSNVAATMPRMSKLPSAAPSSGKTRPFSLNSFIPAAYRRKWPASLCQYSGNSVKVSTRLHSMP